jgi:hypothetical protein
LALAGFLFSLSLLCGCNEHLSGRDFYKSRICLGLIILGSLTILIRCVAGKVLRVRLLIAGAAILLIELLMQVAGWIGVLPAINSKERLPWGRVYWTAEGFENSIRNRYGWHFPEFDLTKTNRIGIIGDSFVEAVEVPRTRNMAAILRHELATTRPGTETMAFGEHGCGPAQYFELLKYAQQYFGIKQAVIVIYLGNDITDCAPKLGVHDRGGFIYYGLTNGVAILDPSEYKARDQFRSDFAAMHRSPWLFLPNLASSYCMSAQLLFSVRKSITNRRQVRLGTAVQPGPEADIARLGLKAGPFAINPSSEMEEGFAIMCSVLTQINEFATSNRIKLMMMTVPFFPPDFYKQKGSRWSARVGDYDFLGPERALKEWALRQNIVLRPLGERMQSNLLTTEQIQELYLSKGCGHFSEKGHAFAAEAMKKMVLADP